MRRLLLYVVLMGAIITACTRTVHVPVLEPARINAGQHIQTIAIIDRTDPENEALHTVKGLLTGQVPGFEKEAVERALDGLRETLQSSPRFQVVHTGKKLPSDNLFGTLPEVLDWDKVDELCEEFDCDAVISLESFSSDLIVTHGSREEEEQHEGGETTTVNRYYAEGLASLKMGFRFYDAHRHTVSDALIFDRKAEWSASGTTVLDAIGLLLDNQRDVLHTSYNVGRDYGFRIAPQWKRVNRTFYTRGRGSDFDIGVRRATVNDWEGAKEAWLKSVKSDHRRTAGRSAYNLALMYEISGDLREAREWAQKAYVDFSIRKARSYVSTLDRRIRERRIVEGE